MFQKRDHLGRIARLAAVAAAVLAADHLGWLRWADHAVTEARMAFAPRPAAGEIVFLGIDKSSLEALGAWPWPRETYGEIARKAIGLGAREIFFDIDVSAPSDGESDAALAAALAEVGGAVILPAFRQAEAIGAFPGSLSDNLPLPAFRQNAWLASVNVVPDGDGRVRRYPYGQTIAGEYVASAAATLSGDFGETGADFTINFAIAPSSIPSFPVVDLLHDRLEAHLLVGRSIVVGAHALELRDSLPVPVHGVIPGPMLQILAAETLMQGIALVEAGKLPAFLAIALLGIAGGASPLRRRPLWLLASFGMVAAAIEVAGFLLQTQGALVLATPILHATLLLQGLAVAASELGLRRWLLQVASVERTNSHGVLQRIIEDSSDAIIVADERGCVIECSARTYVLFAVAPADRSAMTLESILPPGMAVATREAMEEFRNGDTAEVSREEAFDIAGERRHIQFSVMPSRLRRLVGRSGAAREVVLGCVTARDVTLARVQQARLDHLARFDPLTGAMNRAEFVRRLADALADRLAGAPAVFAFNLHRFKTVNATLGRTIGDRLLCAVVARTSQLDPRLSAVGRLGADTFSVFCADLDRAGSEELARKLLAAISAPYDLEGASVRVGLRLGLAFGAGDAAAAKLLENAELALDEMRMLGGDGFREFAPESAALQERARVIERALWSAIEQGELQLVYQPQVELGHHRLVGAEALVRWRHRVLGPISPAEFISIAESSGSIEQLGRWVLEHACRDAASWPEEMSVAVNVSPVQLHRADLLADVRHALAVSGLDARRLHLEITESIFVGSSAHLDWTLDALREMGISLALDDFGSGFASFGYLAKLPIDKLKLDRMFVQHLEDDASNAAIVRSVVMLAHDPGLELVCEGVETEAQAGFLGAVGCDQGQGYFFGRPQDPAAILALFAAEAPGRLRHRSKAPVAQGRVRP